MLKSLFDTSSGAAHTLESAIRDSAAPMSITFEDFDQVDNGARFYSADLHVHSFGASHDVTDQTHTFQAIIDSAVKNGISVLAFTDHNTDKNIDATLDYATRYSGQLLFVPGVEISTAHGHLLVYFSPEESQRVRDLLALLRIEGALGGQDSHTSFSMANVILEAERLGGICVAAHIDRPKTGFETLAPGYPNWKHDILNSPGLYGLEFLHAANLLWYSVDDDSSPNGRERKVLLRGRLNVPSLGGRVHLAALQNSDAHSLSDFEQQHATRNLSRLKMDELSFEGLRTALVDPLARVRAGGSIPARFPRILGMQLQGGFLDSTLVHFSDNLNCFIGGRGTGKSTAVQSLAYCLGVDDNFEDHDNCPDTAVVYCEDGDGVRYRYERSKGFSPNVRAKADDSIADVPLDAFRVDYYPQGHLSEVARDPLRNPRLLQAFLDSQLSLSDLVGREQAVLNELEQNGSQLLPLEASAAQLEGKQKTLADTDKKLTIAEAGRLKDIAALQVRLEAEKALATSLEQVGHTYTRGLSLATFQRDFGALAQGAGTLSEDPTTKALFVQAQGIVAQANETLKTQQQSINGRLRELALNLSGVVQALKKRHATLAQEVAGKIAAFQRQGLTGDLRGLGTLIKLRTQTAGEIAAITQQKAELENLRTHRSELLAGLAEIRTAVTKRRKAHLTEINKHLRRVIEHYTIFVYYDDSGIIDTYHRFVLEMMHGSYYTEEAANSFCLNTTPADLARWIRLNDRASLEAVCGPAWASQILERGAALTQLHKLEMIAKPPRPIIKVLTKGPNQKVVPITQLSDGQRHTILLTIAMLAESNLPLIIDQPEDDLDNAFIFSSVVQTLRAVKERRQVIVVTHNANIAVLGDSELILPMVRSEYKGKVEERGSIDRAATKVVVQKVLEGGEIAFRRRKEIYGYR
jgi:hypothetical protein